MSRIRIFRDGSLEPIGLDDASAELNEKEHFTWIDLEAPTTDDLSKLRGLLDLHPVAIEDAGIAQQRPKLTRYEGSIFLATIALGDDNEDGDLERHQVCAFMTREAFITIRRDEGFELDGVVQRVNAQPKLLDDGPAFLLWAVLDAVVDTQMDAIQRLDDTAEALEDKVLADHPAIQDVQRESFRLRKNLGIFRRVALPMREMVGSLTRTDTALIPHELTPYYQDVYDHVLRSTDWAESLRDLVETINDTNLNNQSNRMNLVMKKVTSWAAIIAVPTLITGFFGQNITFPLINTHAGFWVSGLLMVAASVALYIQFRRKDWL